MDFWKTDSFHQAILLGEALLLTPGRQAIRGNPYTVYMTEGSYVFDNIHADFLKMCLFY